MRSLLDDSDVESVHSLPIELMNLMDELSKDAQRIDQVIAKKRNLLRQREEGFSIEEWDEEVFQQHQKKGQSVDDLDFASEAKCPRHQLKSKDDLHYIMCNDDEASDNSLKETIKEL